MNPKTHTQLPSANLEEAKEVNRPLPENNRHQGSMVKKAGGQNKVFQLPYKLICSDEFKKRFFAFIEYREDSDCWRWKGFRDKTGYGYISVNGRPRRASRVSFVMHGGEFTEEKCFVCHKCDNPECVNPKHLWAGSNRDNMLDAKNKNRVHSGSSHYAYKNPEKLPHGENHWLCKLTNEEVLKLKKMRQETNFSYPKLAAIFGISKSHAHAICYGTQRKRLI